MNVLVITFSRFRFNLNKTFLFFPDKNLYTRHEIVHHLTSRHSWQHASTAYLHNTMRIVTKTIYYTTHALHTILLYTHSRADGWSDGFC